jgi:hypothetical protein
MQFLPGCLCKSCFCAPHFYGFVCRGLRKRSHSIPFPVIPQFRFGNAGALPTSLFRLINECSLHAPVPVLAVHSVLIVHRTGCEARLY